MQAWLLRREVLWYPQSSKEQVFKVTVQALCILGGSGGKKMMPGVVWADRFFLETVVCPLQFGHLS